VFGSLDLSNEQSGGIQQRLDEMVHERAGSSGVARLTNPINIGVGPSERSWPLMFSGFAQGYCVSGGCWISAPARQQLKKALHRIGFGTGELSS
jgi:hypothetical protein